MSAFLFDPDRHAAQDCHLEYQRCGCGPTWSAASSSAGSPTFCVCRRPNARRFVPFGALCRPRLSAYRRAARPAITAPPSCRACRSPRSRPASSAARTMPAISPSASPATAFPGSTASMSRPVATFLILRSIPNSPIRSPFSTRCGAGSATACTTTPHILTGDFNVAPLEHDVWSHRQLLKVVSHTPIETERLVAIMGGPNWYDVMRAHVPHTDKLYTWWSYRARDWAASDRGRRLDISGSMPATATTALRSRSCARPAAGSAPPITSRSW